jgi:ATP-dependent RNA helicase SUPV3L1/SUV3
MERRPPLPPKPAVVEAAPAEPAPPDVASPEISSPEAISSAETAAPESAPAGTATDDAIAQEPAAATATGDVADITGDAPVASVEIAAPSVTLLPEVVFSSVTSEDAAVEVLPESTPSIEAPAAEALQEEAAVAATTEAVATGDAAPAAPDAVAVVEMVEVWRPGGRPEERRPRHDRSRHRHQDRAQQTAQPVAAAGEAGEGAKHERHRRGRRERSNDFRKPRTDTPAEGVTAAAAEGAPVVREPRDDKGRPPRERFQGKGRENDKHNDKHRGKFGGGRDKGGRDKGGRDKRPDGGPSHRQYATSASPRERERPIDPNSPFAKLAALKEQLTANRKDQH